MKTVRIWFNHWFSTAYHIIKLIKSEEKIDFRIIGSGNNPDSVVRLACDEWYNEESSASNEKYIDFCIDFCIRHSIEIFIPRHNQLLISSFKARFDEINVKLLVDDFSLVSVFHNKSTAYQLFSEKKIGIIPDYRIFRTASGFTDAYKELSEKHSHLCFKFTSDEGGGSFRIIDNEISLFSRSGCHISCEQALQLLSSADKIPEMIMMPVLPDEEVSVDCLRTASGIIMIPRIKGNTRIERIHYDDTILNTCSDFYNKIGLEQPCNIQFKYSDGIPYFLEINTRMSGGVQLSCLASGINIPNIAVNRLLGIEKPWTNNRTDIKVTHIEIPVLVD